MTKRIIGVIIACYFLASCKPLNPSIMFRTPKDYKYTPQQKDTIPEYVIAPNDIISFRLFSNNGIKLVDISESNNNAQQFQQLSRGLSYLVEYDGKVNLPIIDRVDIQGKTLREAELYLEELYNKDINDAFILLNVDNRRVTVFTGDGGSGTVITLENNNVKLLEAIALAGGISNNGRAARVKLIRGDLSNPEVFKIDLSTIEGLEQANIILQANDIIYVEPLGITTRQVLSEISPIFGFLTTAITLFLIIDRLE
tara:strand:+ start:1208 stop:1972 length:765 start_codon:yes stop_codon:yes gene_type:complete